MTGYRVYRGSSPYALTLLATVGDTTNYADTGAAPQLYFYAVHAFNGSGEGPASNLTGMIGKASTPTAMAMPMEAAAYGLLDSRPLGWSLRP